MKIEYKATKSDKLISSILEHNKQLNYNQIKTALRKKDVKVNSKRVNADISIKSDDLIEIFLPAKKPIEIERIFEDENIVVVNKPQGIEVTKKDKAFNSLCLEELVGALACHRIDKNTEGLVILAKNNKVLKEMENGFKTNSIHKNYLTITNGKPKNEAHLFAYLKKDSVKNMVKISEKQTDGAVPIETAYKLLKQKGELNLLDVELLTGKTHQIRAHLAYMGLNILGDEKYGDKLFNKKYHIKKQCLCAYKLSFGFNQNSFLNYLNKTEIIISPSFDIEKLIKQQNSN